MNEKFDSEIFYSEIQDDTFYIYRKSNSITTEDNFKVWKGFKINLIYSAESEIKEDTSIPSDIFFEIRQTAKYFTSKTVLKYINDIGSIDQ